MEHSVRNLVPMAEAPVVSRISQGGRDGASYTTQNVEQATTTLDAASALLIASMVWLTLESHARKDHMEELQALLLDALLDSN